MGLNRGSSAHLSDRRSLSTVSSADAYGWESPTIDSHATMLGFEAGLRPWKDNGQRALERQPPTQHRAIQVRRVRQTGDEAVIIVPSVSSETRDFLPVGYKPSGTIVSNLAFAIFDPPSWNIALIASRLHVIWIATVCGKLETRYRYSNTLGGTPSPFPC